MDISRYRVEILKIQNRLEILAKGIYSENTHNQHDSPAILQSQRILDDFNDLIAKISHDREGDREIYTRIAEENPLNTLMKDKK